MDKITVFITCRAYMRAPQSAELFYSYDGRAVGFKLADGSIIKPWIIFEHQVDDGADGKDISEVELEELGFDGFEYGDTEINEEATEHE